VQSKQNQSAVHCMCFTGFVVINSWHSSFILMQKNGYKNSEVKLPFAQHEGVCGVEIQLHSFLTLSLEGGEWVVNLMPKWLKPGEESCDINRTGSCVDFTFGLNTSQTKNIISLLPGIKWWPLGYPAHGLVMTVTMLTQLPATRTTVLYSSDSVEMLRTELNWTELMSHWSYFVMDTNFNFGTRINTGLVPSFQEFNSNNYTVILSEFRHETQAVSHIFLNNVFILDFKLSLCSECCMLSST